MSLIDESDDVRRAMFASVQGDYDVAHAVAVKFASAKAGAHLRAQPHVLQAISDP